MFYIYSSVSLGGTNMTQCAVTYSEKQDRFNFISHLLGIPVGAGILVFALVMFINQKITIGTLTGLVVFSMTAIALYSVSALYHHAEQMTKKKKIRRIVDHCTIYALIAGTYTPICIYIMKENVIGLVLLILQWSLAIIGVVLNAISLDNKVIKVISMILYIAMGWMILYTTGFTQLPQLSFIFILIGGIIYTIGSILYGIGHANKWFHSIFHVFVLFGTIFQTVGVIFLFI